MGILKMLYQDAGRQKIVKARQKAGEIYYVR